MRSHSCFWRQASFCVSLVVSKNGRFARRFASGGGAYEMEDRAHATNLHSATSVVYIIDHEDHE